MALPFINMLAQGAVEATSEAAAAADTTAPTFFERLITNDTIRNTTPMGWATLFGGILGGVVMGKIVGTMLRATSARLATRGWQMRSIVIGSLAGPANLAIIGLGLSIGFGSLAPSPQLRELASNSLGLLYIISLAWLVYNLVSLIEAALRNITSRTASKLDDQLVPLVTKTIRIFLVVIFALFAAENIFNADIGAWLAGLGIAGLAVSLAAQDSIKNVFGSITILLDQPFAVGEFVKIGEFMGTVEQIGFRSTRMRTPDGSVVTIPNSRAADSNIENLARRLAIRRNMDVTITYDTPPHKIEEAIAILKSILAEPEIAESFDLEKFPPRVIFNNLNADSLNIRVSYWFKPVDIWLFMEHSEKVNLRLMRRFDEAGIDFAFPTQTMYLASDPKRPLRLTQPMEAKAS